MTRSDLLRLGCLSLAVAIAVSGFAQDGRKFGSREKIDWTGIPPIVKKMIEQAPKLRYSGERLVEIKAGPDRKKFIDYILKDGVRQRTSFPRGSEYAGQILIEDGKRRLQYFPDRREIEVSPAHRDEMTERMFGMIRAVQRGAAKIVSDKGEAVAGLNTELVTVSDTRGNPFQRMWIEPRSGVLLKREFYDPVGAVMGRFEFTKINLSPVFDRSDFEMNVPGAKFVTQADLAKRLMKKEDFEEAFLPANAGFELQGSRLIPHENGKMLALFYRYKEKSITLFQVSGRIDTDRLKRMRPPSGGGAWNAHSWSEGGRTYVILGQLSEAEMEKLEDKVRGRES